MRIHLFESTGEAYDACQCDEDIKDGDVLVIESERVVGVADTWPFAVTVAHGNLHVLKDGIEKLEKEALNVGREDAIKYARDFGYEVR